MNSSLTANENPNRFFDRHIVCPFCSSPDTAIVSLFGGNAGETLMQCRCCRSGFHWIKWEGKLPPYPGSR